MNNVDREGIPELSTEIKRGQGGLYLLHICLGAIHKPRSHFFQNFDPFCYYWLRGLSMALTLFSERSYNDWTLRRKLALVFGMVFMVYWTQCDESVFALRFLS